MAFWNKSEPKRKSAPKPVPPLAPGDEIERVLRESCSQRVPATLLLRESGQLLHAHFESVTDHFVTLRLDAAQAAPPIHTLSLLCVSFNQGRQAIVFLSPVRHSDCDGDEGGRLVLGLPTQMIAEDVRSAFRVPVLRGSGLQVRARAQGGHVFQGHAVNVSLSGMLLRFDDGVPDTLRTHMELEVELAFGDSEITLAGAVRRRDDLQVGIQFPGAMRGGRLEPSEALQELVKSLERYWLTQKAG